MTDKDAIIKIIGIVINDSYDRELELLRWLFRKLDEVEGKDNV
jgi:hypothetical protein